VRPGGLPVLVLAQAVARAWEWRCGSPSRGWMIARADGEDDGVRDNRMSDYRVLVPVSSEGSRADSVCRACVKHPSRSRTRRALLAAC